MAVSLFVSFIYYVNGRESTVNRVLDGSIYPGEKLVPSSLKVFVRCLEIQQLILEIGNAI